MNISFGKATSYSNSKQALILEKQLAESVYFIGQRYVHHAQHSGYEGFSRYIGTFSQSPVNFRWISSKWGWGLNILVAQLTRHPMYSVGAFLTEVSTLAKMLLRRRCLFHLLYGDSDLWLLGFFAWFYHLTGNRVVASFHEPSDCLRSIPILKKVTRNIDGVILVSESQRAYFEEFLPPERIFVVPHGIDTDFFCPKEKLASDPVCITVGSHLRDFATLKEVMRLVWEVNPNIRWVAVGVNIDKRNLFGNSDDKRVCLLTGIDDEDLRDAYRDSQVAVFTLKGATANNALLEAMACGLPTAITDIGGIREYVDEACSVLCSPNDPQTFSKHLLRLLENPLECQAKADASRCRALAHDYALIAKKHNEIYLAILGVQ